MADKVQLIKEEIERLKNHTLNVQKSTNGLITSVGRGRVEAFNDILKFINSLPEEHNEDLEEAAKEWAENHFQDFIETEDDPGYWCSRFGFISGAEWQKKKDQETIELAEDHAMLAGMNKMKEEMMKDAVEGRVQCGYGDGNKLSIKAMLPQDSDLKYADKVKVLILKTEQQ